MSQGDYDSDMEPITDPMYDKTVTIMMDYYKGKDKLTIDGILSTVGDYRKMATEWTGSKIRLVEMDPRSKETQELAKWKGNTVELALLSHEDYNLTQFLIDMSQWRGNTLCISYAGPKIFDNPKITEQFMSYSPQYKELYFKDCNLSNKMLDKIRRITRLQIRTKRVKYTDEPEIDGMINAMHL